MSEFPAIDRVISVLRERFHRDEPASALSEAAAIDSIDEHNTAVTEAASIKVDINESPRNALPVLREIAHSRASQDWKEYIVWKRGQQSGASSLTFNAYQNTCRRKGNALSRCITFCFTWRCFNGLKCNVLRRRYMRQRIAHQCSTSEYYLEKLLQKIRQDVVNTYGKERLAHMYWRLAALRTGFRAFLMNL